TREMRYYDTGQYFEATSICQTPDGSLWVSTAGGLLEKYQPAIDGFRSVDMFSHSPANGGVWIEKIYSGFGGLILVGSSIHGAKLFDPKTGVYEDILTYNPDKTGIFARNFIQASDDECWIGTESGIFIYQLHSKKLINLHKKYNDPYSVSDNAVYT